VRSALDEKIGLNGVQANCDCADARLPVHRQLYRVSPRFSQCRAGSEKTATKSAASAATTHEWGDTTLNFDDHPVLGSEPVKLLEGFLHQILLFCRQILPLVGCFQLFAKIAGNCLRLL
jgi:hypothetical protein